MSIHDLPTLNACLNATATVLLICGWKAIKANDREKHKRFMISALCVSIIFLCSYLTYHFLVPGVTRYQGEGILRVIYFTILLTHTPLAAIVAPACLVAVWFAVKGKFEQHKKVTRWLYPVWLYVSVTGVIIYLMLYVFS